MRRAAHGIFEILNRITWCFYGAALAEPGVLPLPQLALFGLLILITATVEGATR